MNDVLNYIAPLDHTGYACAATGYIKLLREAGVSVHVQPLQPGPGLGLWYECASSAEILDPHAVTILHAVPEYYAPLKQWLYQRGVCGPVVGMTVWETNQIPTDWPAILNELHAVIVPSAWNRRVFQQCGVRVPVFEVPHVSQFGGVRASETGVQALRARLPNLHGKFVFYSIGAWTIRKGNDLLIRAFLRAFAMRDDVALVLKTSPVSFDSPRPRWQRALRRVARTRDLHQELMRGHVPGVTALTEDLPEEEVRALHTIGDCYVSCARGEGWALGLYEAILFGNPVLAPQAGGHRDYVPDSNFEGLLPGKSTAVRTPGHDGSYTADQEWFEIDVAQAAQKMFIARADASSLRSAVRTLSEENRCLLNRDKILTDLLTALSMFGR